MANGEFPNAIAQTTRDTAMRTANSFARVMVCYVSYPSKDEDPKDLSWYSKYVPRLPSWFLIKWKTFKLIRALFHDSTILTISDFIKCFGNWQFPTAYESVKWTQLTWHNIKVSSNINVQSGNICNKCEKRGNALTSDNRGSRWVRNERYYLHRLLSPIN